MQNQRRRRFPGRPIPGERREPLGIQPGVRRTLRAGDGAQLVGKHDAGHRQDENDNGHGYADDDVHPTDGASKCRRMHSRLVNARTTQ